MPYKTKIFNRLQSLEDIEGVDVEMGDGSRSFTIRYNTQQSLDFYFKWIDDNHWVGYFEDKKGGTSHAEISLWTPFDGVQFATAYFLMIDLRAGRLSPL
jgi:hypothetical protein